MLQLVANGHRQHSETPAVQQELEILKGFGASNKIFQHSSAVTVARRSISWWTCIPDHHQHSANSADVLDCWKRAHCEPHLCAIILRWQTSVNRTNTLISMQNYLHKMGVFTRTALAKSRKSHVLKAGGEGVVA